MRKSVMAEKIQNREFSSVRNQFNQLQKQYINIAEYGAIPNTDIYDLLTSLIPLSIIQRRPLYIPNQTYLLSSEILLEDISGLNIISDYGTIQCSNGNHSVIEIVARHSDLYNINIKGLKFIGNKSEYVEWTINTAYDIGDRIYAYDNIYECTIAGTSGSAYPTHTSGIAIDGTVTWNYISKIPTGFGFQVFGASTYKLHNVLIDDCKFSEFITNGINLEDTYKGNITKTETYNNIFHGVAIKDGEYYLDTIYSHNNGFYGIDFTGGDDSYATAVGNNIRLVKNGLINGGGGFKTAGDWEISLSNVDLIDNYYGCTKTNPCRRWSLSNVKSSGNIYPAINFISNGTVGVVDKNLLQLNNFRSVGDNTGNSTNGVVYIPTNGIAEMSNIHIDNPTRNGVNIGGEALINNLYITGCTVNAPLQVTGKVTVNSGNIMNNEYLYGAYFDTPKNCIINNVEFGDTRTTKVQSRGIMVEARTSGQTAGNIQVFGCDFNACGATKIRDDGNHVVELNSVSAPTVIL